MTVGLTPIEFDQQFQLFADSTTSTSVFRWEALQYYAIARDEPSLVAFRTGAPRPERSVRTSPWLARIATSTSAGKDWTRLRYVEEPLSEYVRWEILAYIESQAVGERIRFAPTRSVDDRSPDFWLFEGTADDDRRAIVMHYDDTGAPLEFELVTDSDRIEEFRSLRWSLTGAGDVVSLNSYLASRG